MCIVQWGNSSAKATPNVADGQEKITFTLHNHAYIVEQRVYTFPEQNMTPPPHNLHVMTLYSVFFFLAASSRVHSFRALSSHISTFLSSAFSVI